MRTFEEFSDQEAQQYLERYVASLPGLRARFARRLERTGGPAVDVSVEALHDLDAWYEVQILDPVPDGESGVPLWWDPSKSRGVPSEEQLRLVDDVGAHLAAVLQAAVPTADWVVRKQPGGSRTYGHQSTVLRMAELLQVRPWNLAYTHLASMIGERPLRKNLLHTNVTGVLGKAGVCGG